MSVQRGGVTALNNRRRLWLFEPQRSTVQTGNWSCVVQSKTCSGPGNLADTSCRSCEREITVISVSDAISIIDQRRSSFALSPFVLISMSRKNKKSLHVCLLRRSGDEKMEIKMAGLKLKHVGRVSVL